MGKLTNLNNLDKLSKALDARYKELIDEEKARAIAEEQVLQTEIDITKEMFGGKSIKYITQAEYDALTEDEKNSGAVTYFIIDAVDLSHDHENKEFLDNLAARNIAIGNKSQSFDGINDLVYSIEDIGAAPAEHSHDDKYYTESEIDLKLEDVNELINEEKARALAEEQALQAEINVTKDMFGGKSIRYLTLDEYEALTEEERNRLDITYFITDVVDLSHDHGNKEFLDNLDVRNITIGNKTQLFDGVNDLNYSINDIGAAPAEHSHDGKYYTESEIDLKLEDVNEVINEHVAELQAGIKTLESDKADQSYVDEKLEGVDALTLNGYSIWVGTTAELEAIETRDPNTLYFELDDDTGEEVVQVDIVNGILQLTADKYQKTNMVDGTEIVFPSVNKFTEIHLYFTSDIIMNLTFPDCRWRVEPNIEEGNSYEIIATYNTIEWLVNVITYS